MELTEQIQVEGSAYAIVVLKPTKKRRISSGRYALDVAGTVDAQEAAAEKVVSLLEKVSDPRAQAIKQDALYQSQRGKSVSTLSKPRAGGKPLYLRNLGVVLGAVDRQTFSQLMKLRGTEVKEVVAAAEMSLIRPEVELDIASAEPVSWGLQMLEVEKLWGLNHTGQGVLVGHLDTGVDQSHPMLTGAIDTFAEFDLLGELKTNSLGLDSGSHGTHTASIIAGREHNGRRFGVAPGAKLAVAQVIEGGNVTARVLAGIDWAMEQGAKVVNMSLGLRGYRPLLEEIVLAMRARNVLPVVAIGNEGAGTSRTPGNAVGALSVGAVDGDRTVWTGSSSQQFWVKGVARYTPDVLAPGVSVPCAAPNQGIATATGTSLAAPHIAGLAALLWHAYPAARVEQIEIAIFDSCTRPSHISQLRGNRGIPNAPIALDNLARLMTS